MCRLISKHLRLYELRNSLNSMISMWKLSNSNLIPNQCFYFIKSILISHKKIQLEIRFDQIPYFKLHPKFTHFHYNYTPSHVYITYMTRNIWQWGIPYQIIKNKRFMSYDHFHFCRFFISGWCSATFSLDIKHCRILHRQCVPIYLHFQPISYTYLENFSS